MYFHPLPELLMLNKQNPGDFSGFWLSDNSQAALTANSRLVLLFIPNESNAPHLARKQAFPNGKTKSCAPGLQAGTGTHRLRAGDANAGRSGLDRSIFRFQCSVFACVIYASPLLLRTSGNV